MIPLGVLIYAGTGVAGLIMGFAPRLRLRFRDGWPPCKKIWLTNRSSLLQGQIDLLLRERAATTSASVTRYRFTSITWVA